MANPETSPELWVVCGPNGAGKSTIASRHLYRRMPIINPDIIARDTAVSAPAAGRAAVLERASLLSRRQTFGWETTLSGRGELRFLREARAAGYRITVVFVGVPSPVLSDSRVATRVASGEHDVPTRDLTRRFHGSLRNLAEVFALAHRVVLADNGTRQYRLLLTWEDGAVTQRAPTLPPWARAALPAEVLGEC
ncbi:AAA family ATPase [Roseospira marina]|uniref:AAA family ATPase n=1 Tax=Roseospira marina TaxID=140057 RepID=A0A5M6I959_9PROT|nr:AAA family ATPase [Roseospira marina]KAA5604702.1 AAA family ATPase [Roseospira marina]MBB4315150.1 putative ABC-type ATPase [Roseospira marina]MBB5088080.1 putative ABC-type ATPase [Roseospira marina]